MFPQLSILAFITLGSHLFGLSSNSYEDPTVASIMPNAHICYFYISDSAKRVPFLRWGNGSSELLSNLPQLGFKPTLAYFQSPHACFYTTVWGTWRLDPLFSYYALGKINRYTTTTNTELSAMQSCEQNCGNKIERTSHSTGLLNKAWQRKDWRMIKSVQTKGTT